MKVNTYMGTTRNQNL